MNGSLELIVAMSDNRAIGLNNKLPWNIKEDMRWFKENTIGKTIVMGRKTHESIGRCLPDRKNIVVSKNTNYRSPFSDVEVYNSVEQVFIRNEDVMVIGGAEIYKRTIGYVNKMFITQVHGNFDGDAFFPEFDAAKWNLIYSKDSNNDLYKYTFKILTRAGV